MRECGLIRLAVPQTSAGQVGAIRRINHGWTFPVAERSPAQVGDIGNELIEAWINEIDELQLKHGTPPVSSQATGNTKNGRFGKWRIEDLLGKLGRKLLSKAKHAALGILDIFAKENSSRIFLKSGTQGFVYCIADPIFSGRQDFLVDLWRRFADVREKLVRRRILGFFRFTVLAPNALLNFLIQLRVFLGGDDAFLD